MSRLGGSTGPATSVQTGFEGGGGGEDSTLQVLNDWDAGLVMVSKRWSRHVRVGAKRHRHEQEVVHPPTHRYLRSIHVPFA